jgi:hypothetical protein
MSKILAGCLILCVLCAPASLLAQEGALQRIREDASGTHKSKSSDDKDKHDDDDGFLGDFLSSLFSGDSSDSDDDGKSARAWLLIALGGPFALPHLALSDDFHTPGYFPPYPYAQGELGYMQIGASAARESDAPDFTRAWSARLAVEESNDFDRINRVAGRLLVETTSRFGLQTNWTYLHEILPCGCTDESALGDFNLTYRFAQNEYAQFRAGLGARVMTDRWATNWGFNFTYGLDFFPVKPVVVSGTIDAGTLGSAGLFRAQTSIGLLLRRWEIYGGYDFMRIGVTNLQGPTVGVRLWF